MQQLMLEIAQTAIALAFAVVAFYVGVTEHMDSCGFWCASPSDQSSAASPSSTPRSRGSARRSRTALLNVTFRFLILYAEFLKYWPLAKPAALGTLAAGVR